MQRHFETPQNSDFLKKLNIQIEHHLSDSSLDVKRWTILVGMSRSDLYRKLSRTVGMYVTEYVRHVRLHHAARLLIDKREWTIYRVALEVGFSSQSYFGKRFKELFGTSPAKYRKNTQN